jgi:hypothetical protein
VQDDVGASLLPLAGRHGVALTAVGDPLDRLFIRNPGAAGDHNLVGDHEGGVEANAKLTDHRAGVLAAFLDRGGQRPGSRLGDGAEVLGGLLGG